MAPYGDFTKVSDIGKKFEIGLCILWVLSVLMCIVMVIIKLVQTIIRKDKRSLGICAVLSMITELLIFTALIFIVKNALSGTELPEKYFWTFYAIFALLVIMLTLIIIWIRGLIKTPMKKGTRVFNIITLITVSPQSPGVYPNQSQNVKITPNRS